MTSEYSTSLAPSAKSFFVFAISFLFFLSFFKVYAAKKADISLLSEPESSTKPAASLKSTNKTILKDSVSVDAVKSSMQSNPKPVATSSNRHLDVVSCVYQNNFVYNFDCWQYEKNPYYVRSSGSGSYRSLSFSFAPSFLTDLQVIHIHFQRFILVLGVFLISHLPYFYKRRKELLSNVALSIGTSLMYYVYYILVPVKGLYVLLLSAAFVIGLNYSFFHTLVTKKKISSIESLKVFSLLIFLVLITYLLNKQFAVSSLWTLWSY